MSNYCVFVALVIIQNCQKDLSKRETPGTNGTTLT